MAISEALSPRRLNLEVSLLAARVAVAECKRNQLLSKIPEGDQRGIFVAAIERIPSQAQALAKALNQENDAPMKQRYYT
jgi:hypothetical protein